MSEQMGLDSKLASRIRANRSDQDAWRAYSELLDKRGDRRGRLIEIDMTLDGMPSLRQRVALPQERKQLLEEIESEWIDALGFASRPDWSWAYGGVRKLKAHGRDIDAIMKFLSSEISLPFDSLRLEGATMEHLFSLLPEISLAGPSSFELVSGHIGDEGVRALAAFEWMQPLMDLTVMSDRIGNDGAQAIAESRTLTKLRRLVLAENYIEDEGVAALVSSPNIEALEELNLARNVLLSPAAEHIAGSVGLSRLKTLNLADNEIEEVGAVAIAVSKHLRSLTALWLSFNRIGTGGVDAIARSERMRRLEVLGLADTGLTLAGVKELAQSRYLSNIRNLLLGKNGLDEEAKKTLAESPFLAKEIKVSF